MKNILILAIFLNCNLYAQLQFKKYGMDDGFSDISFRSILQDNKGFLWFATINGLNRYDGKNVKVYINDKDNPYSLSYNRIYKIYEDYYGYIWILTYDNEIHRLDTETDKIININNIIKSKSGSSFSSFNFHESSPGKIWIYSRLDGVVRITTGSRKETKIGVDFFNKSNILPSNTIRFMHTDKHGSLWIATINGLVKLDNDSIKNSSSSYKTFLVQDSAELTAYCELGNRMLFGTIHKGLFEYSFDNQEFVFLDKYKIKTAIWGITNGKSDDVLVSTLGDGLFYITNEGKNFVHLKPGQKRGDIVEKEYEIIYNDKYGKYWIRRPKRGVTLFDPENLQITTYKLHPEIRESLGEKDAPKLFEDSNSDLWITLYGGGLCKLNRKTMTFEQYFHIADNPSSLSSNFILSIFEDNSKNLWLGTYQGGLNKLEIGKYPFKYTQPVESMLFQSLNEVRAVMFDKYDRTWIGTKEGHVYCYNQEGKKLFKFPDDIGLPDGFIKSNVYELYEDNRGNLWIGTKGYGLYIIEGMFLSEKFKETYNIKHFHYEKQESPIANFDYNGQDESPNYLSNNDVYSIHQDHMGQMWIGTHGGGVNLIESLDDINFKWFKNNPLDTNTLPENKVRYIFQDSKFNLLICTSKGLVLLEEKYLKAKNKKFVLLNDSSVKGSIQTNNDVISCFEDSKNRIWTGTYGNGLNLLQFDTIEGKYFSENFNMKDGLPSAVIHAIEEGNNGNLWLGTDNGLCKFNYETKKIENYYKEEGLGDNLFSEGTSDNNLKGKLIFGLKKGFISFYLDSIKKDTLSYNIFLTGIKIMGEPLMPAVDGSPLERTIESTKEIVLKYDQNFIEIQYAILDYMSPKRCQYKYLLEGIDENWIFAGNNQIATYTNLDPGNYKFRVQASNHDGFWGNQEATLVIKIKPPYYKTWLFKILSALVLITLVYLYFRRRVNRLRNSKLHLERLVAERTYEVEEKNKILIKQTKELNKINSVLKERQNYIVQQTKELSLKNIDLEKSNATKDKLFTIIAHDLKNPFNSILGFCNVILMKYDNIDKDRIRYYVEIIFKSSKSVFNLLENLLQWSRSQMGSIVFEPVSINVLDLMNQNITVVENMFIEKNITLNIEINNDLKVYADSNMLNTIVRNLIMNSIKFTESGSIFIRAKDRGETVAIEIEDTGIGIEKEILDHLFTIENTVSTRGTKGETGSGLGLIICKEFIENNNGSIYVKSKVGKGAIFGFTLPVAK